MSHRRALVASRPGRQCPPPQRGAEPSRAGAAVAAGPPRPPGGDAAAPRRGALTGPAGRPTEPPVAAKTCAVRSVEKKGGEARTPS